MSLSPLPITRMKHPRRGGAFVPSPRRQFNPFPWAFQPPLTLLPPFSPFLMFSMLMLRQHTSSFRFHPGLLQEFLSLCSSLKSGLFLSTPFLPCPLSLHYIFSVGFNYHPCADDSHILSTVFHALLVVNVQLGLIPTVFQWVSMCHRSLEVKQNKTNQKPHTHFPFPLLLEPTT